MAFDKVRNEIGQSEKIIEEGNTEEALKISAYVRGAIDAVQFYFEIKDKHSPESVVTRIRNIINTANNEKFPNNYLRGVYDASEDYSISVPNSEESKQLNLSHF